MKHKITITASVEVGIAKIEYANTIYYQVRGTLDNKINRRSGQCCLTKKEAVASWLLKFSVVDIAATLIDTIKEIEA